MFTPLWRMIMIITLKLTPTWQPMKPMGMRLPRLILRGRRKVKQRQQWLTVSSFTWMNKSSWK